MLAICATGSDSSEIRANHQLRLQQRAEHHGQTQIRLAARPGFTSGNRHHAAGAGEGRHGRTRARTERNRLEADPAAVNEKCSETLPTTASVHNDRI